MIERFTHILGLALISALAVACSIQPLTPTAEPTASLSSVSAARALSASAIVLTQSLTGNPPAVVLPTTAPEVVSSPTIPVLTATPIILAEVVVAPTTAPLLPADTPVPVVAVAAPFSDDAAAAEQYTIDRINAERAAAGVAALARDETLMSIAHARVADMIARGYTGHNDPVTGEALGAALMRAAGYTFVGENWYGSRLGPPDIADVAMNWFMTDAPHYRNILNLNYSGVGVGIGFNGQQWLLVQDFAGQ